MNASEFHGERQAASIAQVLVACSAARAADAAPLLRRGYTAIAEELTLTPAASLAALPPRVQFEAMLLCGAMESAALALLPHNASYMLSRGANGRHLGSVFMAECGEHMAEGSTAALALVAAALAAWRELLLAATAQPGRLH